MKVELSEIQKNLQGTNSGEDEAKNQINNLEHKEEKSIQSEQQEEKRIQKKRLRSPCYIRINRGARRRRQRARS